MRRPLTTVTPTLDGDVLAILARLDAACTSGQLARMLTRFSEEGIRKVLRRLTDQGVVSAERVGQANSYRLNRDHLAAAPIIALANLQTTLLDRLERRLSEWEVPVVYGAVFGSMARGTATTDSDLDLLLVRADDALEDTWRSQVADLSAAATAWTGNDTRPLEYTVSELVNARDEPVLHTLTADALTVAGKRAWLTQQLRHPGPDRA